MMESDLLKFWAKTSHDHENHPNAFHPLICHMIDVAAVTRSMWENVLSNAAKERINKAFGVEDAGNLVAFIAGLHDLGKCSPPFALRGRSNEANEASLAQSISTQTEGKSFRSDRIHGRLQTIRLLELYRETDFWVSGVKKAGEVPHGYVTAVELPVILSEQCGFNKKISKQIATLIGGHHGVFPTSGEIQRIGRWGEPSIGGRSWMLARIGLTSALAKLFDPLPVHQESEQSLDNGTIMILSGLVSVADWIGSDTEFFESAVEFAKVAESEKSGIQFKFINFESYLEHAQAKAQTALFQLGWVHKKIDSRTMIPFEELKKKERFKKLFPIITDLRHLQVVAIEISKELYKPGIAVIEAPTGEGKTEAAMFLADAWNSHLNQTGYYFALPTQATSNQMFGRAKEFLENRFPGTNVNVQLTHGHASLSGEFETLKEEHKKLLKGIYDDQCVGDECVPTVVAAEWFTYRKRGLLAPFGVGTVDQALMSVLQTRHVFVRLFGLSHKTVIIDEVHAYDAYMSTLLERLLEWLGALGSPVILLSATLPAERRNKLIKSYQRGLGIETGEIETAKYPRISYATEAKIKIRHIEASEKSRTLYIKKVDENFTKELKEKLKREGGCAAIICNTVQRSQDVFEELSKDEFFRDKLDLLHARFRYIEREERESRILKRFGKPGQNGASPLRPKCAVLIATQIIEQSLDLDFDLMISDLAPIDLLLQRAGRLQRHDRDSDKIQEIDKRPRAFRNKPVLWIISPPTDENGHLKPDNKGLPDFGKAGVIYDRYISLRTWLELKEKNEIQIPNEVEGLIEAVYSEQFECPDGKYLAFWDVSKKAMEDNLREKRLKAKNCRITDADDEDLFEHVILELDEDNPEIHKTLQALTRDNEMLSVSVVVLTHEEAKRLNTESTLSKDDIKFLLMRETRITKAGLTHNIIGDEDMKTKSWRNSALLRHHRLVALDENNKRTIGNFIVSLNKELGIVIEKGDKNGR